MKNRPLVLHLDLSVGVLGAPEVLRGGSLTGDGGGGGAARPQRRGGVRVVVVVVAGVLAAADRRPERVAEVLRRPVVDDGVDARVGVREPGAEDVDGLVPVLRRRAVEVDEQDEDVERQPEHGEDDHDEDQQPAHLTLAVRRTRLLSPHTRRPLDYCKTFFSFIIRIHICLPVPQSW